MHLIERIHEIFGKSQTENGGTSSVSSQEIDKHTEEFLRYRLISIDRMLRQPEMNAENRDILLAIRSKVEEELGRCSR